ncbi:MAG: 2-dehydro-3-deoxygalactonokinase [Devosia sp.]
MSGKVEWIAVDWGTSNLRAWGMDVAGNASFSAESDKGMGKLAREQFPAALLDLLAPHAGNVAPIDAVICGMAGARQGWLEAPYLEAPARLSDLAARSVNVTAGHISGRILPGVAQKTAGHEDVMRGEETQLLGLLRLKPGFTGVAILPGTHGKWAEVADGRLIRFATAMTGELFEALSTHTVLRHSFNGTQNGPAAEDGVDAGLTAGLAEPQLLTSLLFRTRAAALLSGKGADWCAGYLSGLLVGAEIAGHRDWLKGQSVPLIGSARLNRLYGAALARLGIASEPIHASDATLAGLIEARRLSQ